MPRTRPASQVRSVLALKASGRSDREASELTGVPVTTIRAWRSRGLSRSARRSLTPAAFCDACGGESHDFARLPPEPYAYLLGVYLGDGCLARWGASWTLRIALDASYPWIVISCCDAIEDINPAPRPAARPDDRTRCVRIASTWKQWPCLLPQHGSGRKHRRKIELVDWQRSIVDAAPQAFLRGLIHTDGWRGTNRVRVKGRTYAYPRYQFSNRSDDIRRLFTDACDQLGVAWRPWGRFHISVARRDAVAALDRFIGPKS